jgi:hypothetical protein
MMAGDLQWNNATKRMRDGIPPVATGLLNQLRQIAQTSAAPLALGLSRAEQERGITGRSRFRANRNGERRGAANRVLCAPWKPSSPMTVSDFLQHSIKSVQPFAADS